MSAKSSITTPPTAAQGNRGAGCARLAGTGLAPQPRWRSLMALPHAHPLDVIDIRPLGPALHDSVSTSLIKTDRIQLLHLVLPARRDIQEHHVDDDCVLHCLEGDVEIQMPGGVRRLGPGQLVVLPAFQPYSLSARVDSALLMT